MSSSRLSIAPMMGYTDIYMLKLVNLIMSGVDLYTEMDVAQAFIRRSVLDVKKTHSINGRLVLQLGGSDPVLLGECASKAKLMGYDAVNLNVGCPSSRVVQGKIGVILMREPELVARCVESMAAEHFVSVKTRIGLDSDPDNLSELVAMVQAVGCDEVIVHARRAWLNGLDPKQNRTVPPLDYARVCELKLEFPSMFISLNGGISDSSVIDGYFNSIDGFMVGRLFYNNPRIVIGVAKRLGIEVSSFASAVVEYLSYIEAVGANKRYALRHIIPYFKGYPGAASDRSVINDLMNQEHLEKNKIISLAINSG